MNNLEINNALAKKRVIVFPVKQEDLIPRKRGNKSNVSSQLTTTHISFNEFTNKLVSISEDVLQHKLDSNGICYLFVNNNTPCAFINGKLLELEGLKLDEHYSLAKVLLEVIQTIRNINKKFTPKINSAVSAVVLYESMIVTTPRHQLSNNNASPIKSASSSSIYLRPKSKVASAEQNYVEIVSATTNSNSAYGSQPSSTKSSLRRMKSRKSSS